ncbi:MAG: hypothetical protein ACK5MG_04320 [Bacteroidales bacterium]
MKLYNCVFFVAIMLLMACGEDINNNPLEFERGTIWMGVGDERGVVDRIVKYDYAKNDDNLATISLPNTIEGSLKTIDDKYNEAIILASNSRSLKTTAEDNADIVFLDLGKGTISEVSKFPMRLNSTKLYKMEYFPQYNKTYIVTNHGHSNHMKLLSINRNDLDTVAQNSEVVLETNSPGLTELLEEDAILIGTNTSEEKMLVYDTTSNDLYEYYLPGQKLTPVGNTNKKINGGGVRFVYSTSAATYVGVKVSTTLSVSGESKMKLYYVTINKTNGACYEQPVMNLSKDNFDYNQNFVDISSVVDEQSSQLIAVLHTINNKSQVVAIDLMTGALSHKQTYNHIVNGIAKVKM